MGSGQPRADLLVDRRVLMAHHRPTGWHGLTRARFWIATETARLRRLAASLSLLLHLFRTWTALKRMR